MTMIRSVFILSMVLGAMSAGFGDEPGGSVRGVVYGASQWDVNKLIDKVEAAAPRSEPELMAVLKEEGKPYQADKRLPGVTVVLQGEAEKFETDTDSRGNYAFKDVPWGKYSVSVEVPNCPGIIDSDKKTAVDQENVDLSVNNPNEVVNLRPDLFRIDVRGRVTTGVGQPVSGAVVRATRHFSRSDRHLEGAGTPAWTAVTDRNGEYVLKNLPAAGYLRLAGHLLSGRRSLDNVVDIEASAPGYVMSEKPIRIPLVGEENLFIARRFSKIIANIEKASNGTALTERKELVFPVSSKHVIPNIDLVLTKQ